MFRTRRVVQGALLATLGLSSACLGDLIRKFTGEMLEEHLPKGKEGKGLGIPKIPDAPAKANVPAVKLTEASKTDECRAELSAALGTLRDDLGLAIKVGDAQIDSLFAEGMVGITYARDGVRHTPSFRVETAGEGCNLVFFKRAISKPGVSSSTMANYGAVKLSACACE